MDNLDLKINEYKEDAINLLKKLISYKTVLEKYDQNSDAPFGIENKEALEFLLEQAKRDGFLTKNVDNFAGHIEFGSGEEILGVLAHLDVVPVNEVEWDSNPFELSIRDDKMYARGSIDDKGPLVSAYIAMKILKDSGFKPNKRIRLIVGCDEESGSRCLNHYFKTERKPELGFSPDAEFPLIYGEKGMLSYDIIGNENVITKFVCGERYNIVPSKAMCKLSINLEEEFSFFLKRNNYSGEFKDGYYITYGVAAHAMCPQNGINAAYIMFEFLSEYTDSLLAKFVKEYFLDDVYGKKLGYDYYDEDMKELTSNLAIVVVDNSKFRIGVNCRVPVDKQFDVITKKVTSACEKYNYLFINLGHSPRHFVYPNSQLVKTLMESYQEVTGDYESKPVTIGGGTYAREIGNAVAFGPVFVGREDVCHIANEYMYVEDFFNSMKIYMRAMYKLCK